jgi:hypothetical protein
MHFETLFDLQTAGYRPPEDVSMLILLPALVFMLWAARVLFPGDRRAWAASILGGGVAIFIGLGSIAVLIHDWRTHSEMRQAFSRNNYKVLEGPIEALTTTRTGKSVFARTRIRVDGVTFQFGERENEQGLKEADLRRLRLAEGHYVRIAHYGPTILRLEHRRP